MKIILKSFFILIILFQIKTSFSQGINQKLTNNKTGEVILIGQCTIDAFLKDKFIEWYRPEFNSYKYNLQKKTLDSIKPQLTDISIKIVLGTWCSDSREHFPHFMTVLDYLEFDNKNLKIICVDRNRIAGTVPTDYLNIVRVPTFIIYREKTELGRIIETPIESLEKDLLKIFKGIYTQTH